MNAVESCLQSLPWNYGYHIAIFLHHTLSTHPGAFLPSALRDTVFLSSGSPTSVLQSRRSFTTLRVLRVVSWSSHVGRICRLWVEDGKHLVTVNVLNARKKRDFVRCTATKVRIIRVLRVVRMLTFFRELRDSSTFEETQRLFSSIRFDRECAKAWWFIPR